MYVYDNFLSIYLILSEYKCKLSKTNYITKIMQARGCCRGNKLYNCQDIKFFIEQVLSFYIVLIIS